MWPSGAARCPKYISDFAAEPATNYRSSFPSPEQSIEVACSELELALGTRTSVSANFAKLPELLRKPPPKSEV